MKRYVTVLFWLYKIGRCVGPVDAVVKTEITEARTPSPRLSNPLVVVFSYVLALIDVAVLVSHLVAKLLNLYVTNFPKF